MFGKVVTAMVTPFTKDLKIDPTQAGALAYKLVTEQAADAVLVTGTTGESPTLSYEEKLTLYHHVVDRVGDIATVIAGTGSYNTEESIQLSRDEEDIGVLGLMLVTPYYNKPRQENMNRHFKSIAEKTGLPIMLYNVPKRT